MLPTFNHSQYTGNSGAEPQAPIRPTRKQVSRACDWCRARRIKCDNGRPCRACRARDAQCTHKGGDEPRTLPQALREIDKLKLQIKELEAELSKLQLLNGQTPTLTPDQTSFVPSPESSRQATSQDASPTTVSPPAFSSSVKPHWEGIHVATARSDQASYYGPASSFYFVSRIGAYLGKAFQQPCADRSMQPRGANRSVILESSNDEDDRDGPASSLESGMGGKKPSMNRTQEEYFLSLFWEGHHCFMPIVDEVKFRRHYVSLWEPGKPYRKQSPLVDIILALCLQYGYTFIPRDTNSSSDRDASFDDATIAGRWYYRRSQALLTADLESPSITTVQCYIFTFSYLCCASFQNMCHVTLAQGIRTAQIIGLHFDPPESLPRGERELRRRIWWVLWTMEVKTSSKLGRPFLIDQAQVTTQFPSDDLEAASYNGATLGSYGPVTWLTYAIQTQKLIHKASKMTSELFGKCGEVMAQHQLSCIYKDPQSLEHCAEFLASKIPSMRAWLDQVPRELKTQRRGGGEPYSTDRSALEIEVLAPTWLQRQRIWLELLYHSMLTNLSRPFITFHSSSSTYTPLAERHAATCVGHAISHTLIMHQVVTETDHLGGWSEFFMWQWNVTVTLIGFILAYPIHPSTPNARKALDKAIAIFDNFGTDFAVAASAAQITRDLTAKADLLAGRLRSGITSSVVETPVAMSAGRQTAGVDDGLGWLDPSQQIDPNFTSEFMDWALSVDSFNSFERFFDSSNPADPWAFGQS